MSLHPGTWEEKREGVRTVQAGQGEEKISFRGIRRAKKVICFGTMKKKERRDARKTGQERPGGGGWTKGRCQKKKGRSEKKSI